MQRSRPPNPRGRVVAGRDIRTRRISAAPPAGWRRLADTRVSRAPRFELQPRSNLSGAHNPIGRQAMARPPPEVGSSCTRCTPNGENEIGIITELNPRYEE